MPLRLAIRWLLATLFLSLCLGAIPAIAERVVVFAPHPDDEVLGCYSPVKRHIAKGGTVYIVYATNGEASSAGKGDAVQRKDKAIARAAQAGIEKSHLFFLSYPDRMLWQMYLNTSGDSTISAYTHKAYGPDYSYNRAKAGFTRENLLDDVKEILLSVKPDVVYIPSILDTHSDHKAVALFVMDVLRGIAGNGEGMPDVFEYIIHTADVGQLQGQGFSLIELDEELVREKEQIALDYVPEGYDSYQYLHRYEYIRLISTGDEDTILKRFEDAWDVVAKKMGALGYNVNFGVVADVPIDIFDTDIPLNYKLRAYSDDPNIVLDLSRIVCRRLLANKVVPVIKHFPGIGQSYADTHIWLEKVKGINPDELDVFASLLKDFPDAWVMTSHLVYKDIGDIPATLNSEVYELLRGQLGFDGVCITDELNCMQSIKAYAEKKGYGSMYIGKVVVDAFAAGADIALIYCMPNEQLPILKDVLKEVKRALANGMLSQEEFGEALRRIQKAKERIYGINLDEEFARLSIDEQIAQRVIIDTVSAADRLVEMGIGGLHIRRAEAIKELKAEPKIPLFLTGQYEGGQVRQEDVDYYLESPFATGIRYSLSKGIFGSSGRQTGKKRKLLRFDRAPYEGMIKTRLPQYVQTIKRVLDGVINELKKDRHRNVSGLTPLLITPEGYFLLRDVYDLPYEWYNAFETKPDAIAAYFVFRDIYHNWLLSVDERIYPSPYRDNITACLCRLIAAAEAYGQGCNIEDCANRLLFVAAHPDDEDGAVISYFTERYSAASFILYLTSGERGNNFISPCYGADLAALRITEAKTAARISGARAPLFLLLPDVGYTQDRDAVYKRWKEEGAVERLAEFIRQIRPDVVITGHYLEERSGQHSAALDILKKAVEVASDANAGIEGEPWDVPRVYCGGGKDLSGVFKEPLLKDKTKTYKDIFLEVKHAHRSQGDFGWLDRAVEDNGYAPGYALIKGPPPSDPLGIFDGIEAHCLCQTKCGGMPNGIGVVACPKRRIAVYEPTDNTIKMALAVLGVDYDIVPGVSKGSFKNTEAQMAELSKASLADKIVFIGKDIFLSGVEWLGWAKSIADRGAYLVIMPQANNDTSDFIYFEPQPGSPLKRHILPELDDPNGMNINDILTETGFGYVIKKDRLYSCNITPLDGIYLNGDIKTPIIQVWRGERGRIIYIYPYIHMQIRRLEKGAMALLANLVSQE